MGINRVGCDIALKEKLYPVNGIKQFCETKIVFHLVVNRAITKGLNL